MFTHATLARLNAHLTQVGDCWIWTASRATDGYGHVRVNGTLKRVHRFVYETLHGPTPHHVHHLCRTPACCRPEHIEPIEATVHGRMHGGEARTSPAICPIHGTPKVPRSQGGGYVRLRCIACKAEADARRPKRQR